MFTNLSYGNPWEDRYNPFFPRLFLRESLGRSIHNTTLSARMFYFIRALLGKIIIVQSSQGISEEVPGRMITNNIGACIGTQVQTLASSTLGCAASMFARARRNSVPSSVSDSQFLAIFNNTSSNPGKGIPGMPLVSVPH